MDTTSTPTVVITFLSLSRSTDLTISLEGAGIGAYNELMAVFASEIDVEHRRMACNALNQNTVEVRERIRKYVDAYKGMNPRIQKLGDYFKDLEEGEYFFVCPSVESLSFEVTEKLHHYLVSLKDGVPYEEVTRQVDDLFGDLRKIYDIFAVGDFQVAIGESDKNKRVCRFCGKDAAHTTFKSRAHTISKSLGNNNIVTNDECDTCNNDFGKFIEKDLAEYLGVFRSMLGMRGYNGIPHIKGENFDIKQEDGQVKINFHASTEEEERMPVEKMHLPLRSNQRIRLQNVYRSMVKYALSVIDAKEMCHFRDTVEWIFQRNPISVLPQIAILEVPAFYNSQPSIILYTRKTDDKKLPYMVVEFRFAYLVFVAIVPACNKDSLDFTAEADYNRFWQTFKHFSRNQGWRFKDFSSDVDDKFTTDLNILKR